MSLMSLTVDISLQQARRFRRHAREIIVLGIWLQDVNVSIVTDGFQSQI